MAVLRRAILAAALFSAGCGPPAAAPPSVEIPPASAAPSASAAPLAKPRAPAPGTCLKRCIPNTTIEDTEENRRAIALCERYFKALEDTDIPAVLSLASPNYADDSGTPDPADDIDRTNLPNLLQSTLGALDRVRVERHYAKIREQGADVVVEVKSSMKFTLKGAPSEWQTDGERERSFLLERTGSSFKIKKGM